MVVYSLHIFDRHSEGLPSLVLKLQLTASLAECIYSRRWNERPVSGSTKASRPGSSADTAASEAEAARRRERSRSDDAKLIFGTVFSLRNMVRNLGGADNSFLSYRTNEYKLHYYETPTRLKFVMITDTKMNNLRIILHQIWATLYVDFVVKNPLSPIEHPGGIGVANEMFEGGLDRFITTVLPS